MTCTNASDTITQNDGLVLPNAHVVSDYLVDFVQQPQVTSHCRVADGTWVGWFQNYRGSAAADADLDKDAWPSITASATPVSVGYFPDDGSGPFIFPLGVEPRLTWQTIPLYGSADPCSHLFPLGPQYSDAQRFSLSGWFTSVVDVQVRTDGSWVWVIVMAREHVDYPYLTNYPDSDRCGNLHPGLADDLSTEPPRDDGSHDPFFHDSDTGLRYWWHYGSGAGPFDDGGESNSFRWSPHRLTVFAGDIAGFERIDWIDATYQNHAHAGRVSGIEAAASPTEPGILHVMWSESGLYNSHLPDYGQRINYSRWSDSAKTLDVDLASQSDPRNPDEVDEFPAVDSWTWTAEIILRNDHGSPIAIVAPWAVDHDFIEFGPAYLGPLEFWDLSDGTANVIQTQDQALYPTPVETGIPEDMAGIGRLSTPQVVPRRATYGSSLYTDPRLSGQDVYLVVEAFQGKGFGSFGPAAFYRIPVDGSAPFDYMDGTREVGYSIAYSSDFAFPGNPIPPVFLSDFVSDPDNVWFTAESGVGGYIVQLDRQCLRGWRSWYAFPTDLSGSEIASYDFNDISPPIILSLDTGDWLASSGVSPFPLLSGDPTGVGASRAKICRCCLPCNRTGMHVWEVI